MNEYGMLVHWGHLKYREQNLPRGHFVYHTPLGLSWNCTWVIQGEANDCLNHGIALWWDICTGKCANIDLKQLQQIPVWNPCAVDTMAWLIFMWTMSQLVFLTWGDPCRLVYILSTNKPHFLLLMALRMKFPQIIHIWLQNKDFGLENL
jgi:hypothetical protein